MRFTAFIMALLVLVLSCLPCADADAMPDVKTELLKHSGPGHPHQHEDLCSPFCHCSCCSTFSIITIPLLIPAPIQQPAGITYTAQVPDAVIEISLPVWQPPQLV